MRVHLGDVTFYPEDDADTLVWVDKSGDLPFAEPYEEGEIASFLIEVGVDGNITIVKHRGGSQVALEKLIADLQALVVCLDKLGPEGASRGQCVTYEGWGRCRSDSGHDGDHDCPTEDDWRRANPPLKRVSNADVLAALRRPESAS